MRNSKDEKESESPNKKQRVSHDTSASPSESQLEQLPTSSYEEYLQLHKRAVQMNNYGMALLETRDGAGAAVKALKKAIDTMVMVTRLPNDPIRNSFKTSTHANNNVQSVSTELFEQMSSHESPPLISWEGFVLRIPAHYYPMGHSQPKEDAAAILFNMSLAFYLLGSESGEQKWISKGQALYKMALAMAHKAKSDDLARRQPKMMSVNLKRIRRLCEERGEANLARQYLKIASSVDPNYCEGEAEDNNLEHQNTASSKAA